VKIVDELNRHWRLELLEQGHIVNVYRLARKSERLSTFLLLCPTEGPAAALLAAGRVQRFKCFGPLHDFPPNSG